ncbi:MAG: hypothetical protein ACTHNZ_18985 [Trinickia sp.]|uniref:hypothetical protein n=1 Tax=Trinickia sp. TaxID=2571163 RepID=UPI003F7D355A
MHETMLFSCTEITPVQVGHDPLRIRGEFFIGHSGRTEQRELHVCPGPFATTRIALFVPATVPMPSPLFTRLRDMRHQFADVLSCVSPRGHLLEALVRRLLAHQFDMRLSQHVQHCHQRALVGYGFVIARMRARRRRSIHAPILAGQSWRQV